MTMEIKTNISSQRGKQHLVRGNTLLSLIAERSFIEVIFLLWRGNWPTNTEEKFLNALLVAAVEHGVEVPSLYVPRVVASTGNEMRVALAAGMLSIGTRHGGAIAGAAELLAGDESEQLVVESYLAERKPLPGFGHRLYKREDPRARQLEKMARELRLPNTYFERARALEKELKRQKGKLIPLNIDGAMAAGLLTLGFDEHYSEALFILARLVGMAAHVREEQEQQNPYYRLGDNG